MAAQQGSTVRESRHLWVGGLPDQIDENGIKEYFSKFGKIEGVKILPQKYPNLGVAAFIDFYDIKSAIEAKETKHKIKGCELRTNFKAKPTERFEDKKRVSDGPSAADKQENSRGRVSSSSSSDEDSDASSSSSSGSDSNNETKTKPKKSTAEVNSLFLKVTGLANRPERVLQDGLYYEFCRYSSQAVVRMYGDNSDKKWAVVRYKKLEECREAFRQSQGMVLFGTKIKIVPLDVDDFPTGGRDHPFVHHGVGPPSKQFLTDEPDLQATRSLFVGNIPKNISIYELRDIFQRYGNVLDVEIKKMGGNATYGFVLYYDLSSAITAKQYMDGQNLRGNSIRVGFGKGTPSKTVWIDGIDQSMTEQQLEKHLVKHGKVVRLGIDHHRYCAMVQYDTMESAKEALNSLKGTIIGNSKRLLTDFANRDARAAFFSHMEEGEGVGPPRRFHGSPGMFNPGMMGSGPRMMMPRPGMHPIMGMGPEGYPFHGPPMDYFYNPYMEDRMDYYQGVRPPYGASGPGMRRYSHSQYDQGMDDYDEELRAFSRKREWEKEREKHKVKKRHHESSSEPEESDSSDSVKPKKKFGKNKDRQKKVSRKEKEKSSDESDNEDTNHKEARRKATKKSRDIREKLKKAKKWKQADESDVATSSDGELEIEVNRPRKNKGKDVSRSKEEVETSVKETTEAVITGDEEFADKTSSPDPSKPSTPSSKKEQVLQQATRTEDEKDINIQTSSEGVKNTHFEIEVAECKESVILKEEEQSGHKSDHVSRSSSNEHIERIKTVEMESPQSPPAEKQQSLSEVKVESDLSSGEDFKEDDIPMLAMEEPPTTAQSSDCVEDVGEAQQMEVLTQPTNLTEPRTPSDLHEKRSPSANERTQVERKGSGVDSSRKEHRLPRRYQIEEEVENRDSSRYREPKHYYRGNRRSHHPGPSMSPPPSYNRRRHHSPIPPEPDRWYQRRGRPSSPGSYGYQRNSRSPLGYTSSPPYRGRSPYSGSPPPRPRSPMLRRGGQRARYDSPPYDTGRGKYQRRNSPPSPYNYHYSPSPPPRPRSPPPGRRRLRRHTPTFSPPRSPPIRGSRREKSPFADYGGRSSPHYTDDRYDQGKRFGKRPIYSRTPSPKGKHLVKEEVKRRKLEESGPNVLTDTHVSKELSKSYKSDRSQQIHQPGHLTEQHSSKKTLSGSSYTTQGGSRGNDSVQQASNPSKGHSQQQPPAQQQQADNLLDLLRRYPVMWQGHLMLKNDMAAVQLHFLSGNLQLAKTSLPQSVDQRTPSLRIAQRMRLEKSQLEGVERRIQNEGEHCLLLALPCGRDATDVHTQTQNLKNSLISYLLQKQAAGIINVQGPQNGYVLHIFPPCSFSHSHLSRVAPDLLSSASDDCHLMIVAATM